MYLLLRRLPFSFNSSRNSIAVSRAISMASRSASKRFSSLTRSRISARTSSKVTSGAKKVALASSSAREELLSTDALTVALVSAVMLFKLTSTTTEAFDSAVTLASPFEPALPSGPGCPLLALPSVKTGAGGGGGGG